MASHRRGQPVKVELYTYTAGYSHLPVYDLPILSAAWRYTALRHNRSNYSFIPLVF